MKITIKTIPILAAAVFLASCSTQDVAVTGTIVTLAALTPVMVVKNTGEVVTGTNYKRRMMVPEIFRLQNGVYAISNNGGWFTEGRARYGGLENKKGMICLSAWVVDTNINRKNKDERIILDKSNLVEFFWDENDPSKLEKVERREKDAVGTVTEYFVKESGTPFLEIYNQKGRHLLFLSQE